MLRLHRAPIARGAAHRTTCRGTSRQARAASDAEKAALSPKPATSGTQTNQAHSRGTRTDASQRKYLHQGALALHSRPCSRQHPCCSPLTQPEAFQRKHELIAWQRPLESHPASQQALPRSGHAKRQAAYARPTRKDLRPEALPYRRQCCGGVFAEGQRHCAAKTLLLLLRAHLPPPCANDTKKSSTPARRELVFAAACHEPSHTKAHTEEWDGRNGRRKIWSSWSALPPILVYLTDGRPSGGDAATWPGSACMCPAPPAGRIWACPKQRSRRIQEGAATRETGGLHPQAFTSEHLTSGLPFIETFILVSSPWSGSNRGGLCWRRGR